MSSNQAVSPQSSQLLNSQVGKCNDGPVIQLSFKHLRPLKPTNDEVNSQISETEELGKSSFVFATTQKKNYCADWSYHLVKRCLISLIWKKVMFIILQWIKRWFCIYLEWSILLRNLLQHFHYIRNYKLWRRTMSLHLG